MRLANQIRRSALPWWRRVPWWMIVAIPVAAGLWLIILAPAWRLVATLWR